MLFIDGFWLGDNLMPTTLQVDSVTQNALLNLVIWSQDLSSEELFSARFVQTDRFI